VVDLRAAGARHPFADQCPADALGEVGEPAHVRQVEVVAVRLGDPRERELPDLGLVTFEDPETGRQLTVDTGDPALRERFRQAAEAADAATLAALRRRGVDALTVGTEAELLPALVAFLSRRRRAPARGPHLPSTG
jgi:uncharacterized protein (DUF58 family)